MSRQRRADPCQLPLPLVWAPDPTPYEMYVAHTVRELGRWCGGPVPAALVGDHLGLADRTARLYLRRLERARVVELYGGARIVDIRNRSAYRWDDQRGAQSKLVVEIVLEVRG